MLGCHIEIVLVFLLAIEPVNFVGRNPFIDQVEQEKIVLTYYLNTGNYKSAIRFYQELITLFESNQHLILNPPIYYLSALKGILDKYSNTVLVVFPT